jgi:hypothetical protein
MPGRFQPPLGSRSQNGSGFLLNVMECLEISVQYVRDVFGDLFNTIQNNCESEERQTKGKELADRVRHFYVSLFHQSQGVWLRINLMQSGYNYSPVNRLREVILTALSCAL